MSGESCGHGCAHEGEGLQGHAHFPEQNQALPAGLPRPDCSGMKLRHDWTLDEVRAIHELPLMELVYRAQTVHREVWKDNKVQLCSLLSVKTGGCPEDCAYCPQAARYKTGV